MEINGLRLWNYDYLPNEGIYFIHTLYSTLGIEATPSPSPQPKIILSPYKEKTPSSPSTTEK